MADSKRKLPATKGSIESETLVYQFILYECKHGTERASKSKGLRPNQRSLKLGCPAKFKVKMVKVQDNWKLQVVQSDLVHANHMLSQEALEEKEKGNAAYKQKNFDVALQHYDAALELDPTNITLLTNKGAVFYEQGKLDECIKTCEEAVDKGREHRADYKLIAKALSRIATAYLKKDDLNAALNYYNKSLTEHRQTDIVKKAQEVQQKIKEKELLAYINPELSLEEKEKGNQAFKEGNFPLAVQHYTEAIKRNPGDAKIYSNRAACYTKLMEFAMALKDSEDCIKLDPKFIKGYLRKGAVLLAMKEPTKATIAYQRALDLDPNNSEALDGYRKALMAESEDPEAVKQKAMSNPEVQQILSDPAMQMILAQMSKDPKAAREHLKNPDVAAKIEKLMECGIVSLR